MVVVAALRDDRWHLLHRALAIEIEGAQVRVCRRRCGTHKCARGRGCWWGRVRPGSGRVCRVGTTAGGPCAGRRCQGSAGQRLPGGRVWGLRVSRYATACNGR